MSDKSTGSSSTEDRDTPAHAKHSRVWLGISAGFGIFLVLDILLSGFATGCYVKYETGAGGLQIARYTLVVIAYVPSVLARHFPAYSNFFTWEVQKVAGPITIKFSP